MTIRQRSWGFKSSGLPYAILYALSVAHYGVYLSFVMVCFIIYLVSASFFLYFWPVCVICCVLDCVLACLSFCRSMLFIFVWVLLLCVVVQPVCVVRNRALNVFVVFLLFVLDRSSCSIYVRMSFVFLLFVLVVCRSAATWAQGGRATAFRPCPRKHSRGTRCSRFCWSLFIASGYRPFTSQWW